MRLLALLTLASFAFFPAMAQDDALIQTDATHAVILDHDTGTVLYSKNGDELMIPASMTKMMTVQVVFDRLARGELSLSDTLPTSQNAWEKGGFASGGSTMGLAIGDEPTIEELLRGVIILSGNDACIVIAEGLSGTEALFASEMTGLARDLGLSTATFKNSTGLDEPEHRISAADLARLAKLQIEQFPDYYAFYNERAYEWRGIRQTNRNLLLGKVDGVDGLKTGHLSASGYGITVSAEREGKRRIVVVNGLESVQRREQEATRLLRIAFTAFDTRTLAPSDDEVIAEVPVWLGVERTVPVKLGGPLSLSAHKRAFDDAVSEIVYTGPLEAPIEAGTQIGELVVTVPGQAPARAPIVTMRDVSRLGFIGRIAEGLNRIMSNNDE